MDALSDYRMIGALLLIGIGIGAAPLIIPLLIGPRVQGAKTRETYECGVDTIGNSWMQFSLGFYLFALIFVAFEVDILYLFPIALAFDMPGMGWRDVTEIAIFLAILSLAIVFAWRKGVFKWK